MRILICVPLGTLACAVKPVLLIGGLPLGVPC